MRSVRNRNRKLRRGQALVEYTIIVAAVALVALGSISLLGHKTNDMLGTLTAILPGAAYRRQWPDCGRRIGADDGRPRWNHG